MSVEDAAMMGIFSGAIGGVMRALEGQEAQRTAREIAVARENRKGSRLSPEEFVECASDAVGLSSTVTAMIRDREIEAACPDPPDGASAMSQEEIDALLKGDGTGRPS